MAALPKTRPGASGENLLRQALVWQILACLVPRTVIIAILPLLALVAEQASSIQKYLAPNAAARPMFVDSTARRRWQ
jgi:hypothetical protein